ncbi:MAG: YheC/YheD family protein [Bacillota bacterium]|nr:YheC/YheD family protein [Bacillota bacterium]
MDEPYFVTPVRDSRLRGSQLRLGESLAKHLTINNGEVVALFVGCSSVECKVVINQSSSRKQQMVLNPGMFKTMKFLPGKKYGIYRDEMGVHLGPVVGVMADLFNDKDRPFGGQSYFISQVLTAGQKMGELCFAFGPNSINYHRKTISGYRYTQKGWVKGTFPIPDVIYPREAGYSPPKLRIRSRLESMGARFINPPLVGKWQTYKILSQNEELIKYIPDTRLVNSFQQVDRMIKRYHAVYMKPVSGSQGKNIVRVVKKKNNRSYEYQYQMNNQTYRGTAATLHDLQRNLHRVMGRKSYIVQQRINLIRSQGNIIDVRVLVQKDESGRFCVTGKACRVGRNGSITSNISSGGKGRKVESVLLQAFPEPEQRDQILEELNQVALLMAEELENKYEKIGEMGIDIGIDRDGRIWFIEANLRPARQVFSLIGEKKTRMASVEKPMKYARYLAGFSR